MNMKLLFMFFLCNCRTTKSTTFNRKCCKNKYCVVLLDLYECELESVSRNVYKPYPKCSRTLSRHKICFSFSCYEQVISKMG
jgi:hypothetical protein